MLYDWKDSAGPISRCTDWVFSKRRQDAAERIPPETEVSYSDDVITIVNVDKLAGDALAEVAHQVNR